MKESTRSKHVVEKVAWSKHTVGDTSPAHTAEKRPRPPKKSEEALAKKKPRMEAARAYLKYILLESLIQNNATLRVEPFRTVFPEVTQSRDAVKETTPQLKELIGLLKLLRRGKKLELFLNLSLMRLRRIQSSGPSR